MAITSVGTGSGLELESLITQILDAERVPVKTRLDLKQTRVEASISAMGSLKSTLSEFQTSLAKLKNASNFSTRSAISSDSTLFTATATAGAELANYSIEVLSLAKANKLASANFTSAATTVGTGTLSITAGTSSFDIEIEAGVNDSLAGIRDAINDAAGNSGVRASILTVSDGVGGTASKLVLTSTKSGADNAITVAVTGDGDGNDADNAGLSSLLNANLTEIDPAQDAEITVDGFSVTSSTNTFSDAIEGVSLTILKESDDPLETLSGTLNISTDKTGLKANVEGFVANYNALMAIFNTLTDYDPATETRGLLSGDASVSVMERRLRSIMSSVVGDAAEGMNSLAFLGISTNRDGTIALDDAELTSAINTRFDDLGALFTGDNGIASKLDKLVSEFTGAGGVFTTRTNSLQKQLDDIADQRVKMEQRLESIEARYRAQFSALDILVGQLQQTGDFLSQQLEATAQLISGKSS